jgi:hypothetical protein
MGHIWWCRGKAGIPGLVAGPALRLAAVEPGQAQLAVSQPRHQPERVIIQDQRPDDYKTDAPAFWKLTEPLVDIPQSTLTSCNHWRMAIIALLAFVTAPCWVAETRASTSDSVSSWLAMVERTQAAQPRWITPLATVTPRLEQEVRFDFFSQSLNSHGSLTNYGGGKGLEFIPTENTELFIDIPPYDVRRSASGHVLAEGWADWPVFLLKYRLLSANEESGNYVVSTFLQLSAPIGNTAFSNRFYIVQPTLALGKGWGVFDIQATVSEQFPTGGVGSAGRNFGNPVLINVAAQFHVWDFLWPELEANTTWWPDGTREGKVQLFLTPGIIFGRFTIQDRVRLILGAGYQVAVSPAEPSYRNNVILTLRTTF